MNWKELKDDAMSFVKDATTVGAGAPSSSQTQSPGPVILQYPAERDSAVDGNEDSVSRLYRNGLVFKAYNYDSRTTPDLTSQRTEEQKSEGTGLPTGTASGPNVQTPKFSQSLIEAAKASVNRTTAPTKGSKRIDGIKKEHIVTILMPRSKSDNDVTSHKFNDVGESLITRGNGSITGVLSHMASHNVFGAIDSMTQGLMADKNEQIYTTARSMYSGADNRTKTFTWELTPRTVADLENILKIYQYFNFYSYGSVGNSKYAKEIKAAIDEWYQKTFIKRFTPSDANTSGTIMEGITEFLTNVITVSNPTIWFVNHSTFNADGYSSSIELFGPAQIQNIRFDRAPDGQFSGLDVAPNVSSTFVLEITMREILVLNRAHFEEHDL